MILKKILLLNHDSEKSYRNLYRKICDVLFEILCCDTGEIVH